ncbi:MAG TPA: GDP-mannose 4,6-dehydratase [Desulfovibrio sp.]|uniref:NAD-dependent epimerase/dehydratase family protein n=1 Tax=Desulfovibrio sp. TaxID=885 RepID=UPI002C05A561|nr:NAD-dependent epimerase/dehydratase family protein [Desulfovibrio sp.]HMM38435.1 GDP-mannose 4,6-dehydratase [Desulfovibrio sp.]
MNLRNAKVVVTGGAGFIGSHLVDALLARDNEVLVIDDLSSGEMVNLARHAQNPALRVEVADICDAEAMLDLCRGREFVFHLACRGVRLSLRQPTIVHEVNASGTLNMLKAAAACGARRFLYCSSSEVNGTADVVPMPEDYHFKPETIYGASKLTGEYYTQVFQRSGWLETVIIRPHNNYGPREHYSGVLGEVIPRFILLGLAGLPSVVYGDGAQTRDFTYVEETADFMVRALECDAAVGSTMNLCRGQEVSILEIARLVGELTGLDKPPVHMPGRPNDVLRLFGDPSRMRRILGDSPAVSIRDGLEKTVRWFRENVRITPELLLDIQGRNWQAAEPEEWLRPLLQGKTGA